MILNRWPKCVLKGEKIMEEILRQDISQVQSSIVTLSVTDPLTSCMDIHEYHIFKNL